MEKNKNLFDSLNYESDIREVFPNAQINRVYNFDDVYFGWEISPKPGHLIVFKVQINNEFNLRIERYAIEYKLDKYLKHQVIFNGTLPASKDYEPDYNFLQQLLKCYELIG